MANGTDASPRNAWQDMQEQQQKKVKIDRGIHKVFHDEGEDGEDGEEAASSRSSTTQSGGRTDGRETVPDQVGAPASAGPGLLRAVAGLGILIGIAGLGYIVMDLREKWASVNVLADEKRVPAIAADLPGVARLRDGSVVVPVPGAVPLSGRVANMVDGLALIVGYARPEGQSTKRGRTEFFPSHVIHPKANGDFQSSELFIADQGSVDLHLLLAEPHVWQPLSRMVMMGGQGRSMAQMPPALAHKRLRLHVGPVRPSGSQR